ncbi:MAG: DNA-3-methyladenine glycosylase I [Phycisphaerales bacterium]
MEPACLTGEDGVRRCGWARSDADRAYHDAEWGIPSRDETHLFEMLSLEGAQAGLSWSTILGKRAGYRAAFHGFDIERIARMTPRDVDRLVADPAIVRHRGKIESVINNAKAARMLREQRGVSLGAWLWELAGGAPVINEFSSLGTLPAQTPESKAMSAALRRAGFRFVGPTTCYAFMQAVGMVDDHLACCWRRAGGSGH